MKTNKKVLIFAVFIGLLTVVGLNYYIKDLIKEQEKPVSYSQVVTAVNKISVNVKITAEMVTLKSIPTETVHPEAITSVDKVIGKTSSAEIVSGEAILSSRIVTDTNKSTLAYKVPENMRAVSIPNNEVSGVAGHINVGDKIDILVTYDKKDINPVITTYTQLQNIEVVAVGTEKAASEEDKQAVSGSITVIVKPAQAEVIAYAVSNGTMFYTLRNPVDSGKPGLNFYNSTNFATYKER